ncbi:MAG: T9SS type A sorting domain-containing protein [Flavobacteriales bacterium]|nr:T9SS type A sorting domain-containing protein [Flavobacteriales bacterium]
MISEYVGTVDFDGEDRISGIAPDFGADEFGSSIGVSDQQSLAFALYPNPSADSFSLLGWGSERVQLEIYDMVGGLVKQVQTMTNTPVDVRDLAKGSYVVVYRVGRAETSITFIRN